MKGKFRFGSNVIIRSSQKSDGKFNVGKVVGIEANEDASYLGYTSKKEFLSRFKVFSYKVAFIDCITKRASSQWFPESELTNAL